MTTSLLDYVGAFGDRGMGRDVVEELRREPASLVVVDCILFGAMEAVAAEAVPYVVLERRHGCQAHPARRLLNAAAARWIACLAELDPAGSGSRPGNLHYTGPVVAGVPAAPTEPTVPVSLSTVNFPGQARARQNILDALGTLDVRGIATVGPSIGTQNLTAPQNVELRAFVPHAELLPVTAASATSLTVT